MTATLERVLPNPTTRRVLGWVVPLAALAFSVTVWPFPAPLGVVVNGALVGSRVALIALGIALVYRANRVINFAAGDLGQLPASLAVLLVLSWGWNFYVSAVVGLAAAILLGFLVERLIIRRFYKSPRLVVTVATIGIAQLLTALALFMPSWFGDLTVAPRLDPPFTMHLSLPGVIFNGADLTTAFVVPVCFLALALFMQRSSFGTAIRGAAERGDRAATLGVPVMRLNTIVWVIASVLAFIAMFLRATVVGLPVGQVLGPSFLLQALAAAVIGRMERLPTIAIAAIGIGIIDQSMTFQPGNRPPFNDVAIFVIVLGALLLTRRAKTVRGGDVSTWQAAREVRPIPRELAGIPEVRYVRWVIGVVIVGLLLALPLWLSESKINLAAVIVIFGIVGLSLVVLTGLGRTGEPRADGVRRNRCRGRRRAHREPGLGHQPRAARRRARRRGDRGGRRVPGDQKRRIDPAGHHPRVRAVDVLVPAEPGVLRLLAAERADRATGLPRAHRHHERDPVLLLLPRRPRADVRDRTGAAEQPHGSRADRDPGERERRARHTA